MLSRAFGTEKGAADPNYLTEAARHHLRERFCAADAGLTGVNFAIAETGGIVICTNEGNADLGVSLPKIHIACMGMEKLIHERPIWVCFCDCWLDLQPGSRSQRIRPIFMVRNRAMRCICDCRQRPNRDSEFRLQTQPRLYSLRRVHETLAPSYRRSGGHSYQSTVPGPIGSILTPIQTPEQHNTLPFACTLCGSCTDVCPVKIDLHQNYSSCEKFWTARS